MASIDPIVDIFSNAQLQVRQDTTLDNIQRYSDGPKINQSETSKVAQDFEALFLSQMLQALKPEESDKDSLFSNTESDAIFRGMMMEEYAKKMAESGGIGIASYIERELLGQQGTDGPPTRPVPEQWQGLIDHYQHQPLETTSTHDQHL